MTRRSLLAENQIVNGSDDEEQPDCGQVKKRFHIADR